MALIAASMEETHSDLDAYGSWSGCMCHQRHVERVGVLRFMRSDGARVSSKRAAQHRWDDWHHLWVDWHHRWDDWHHRWVDWHSHFVRCYF